ncbi:MULTISPECIES: 3-hydroxyacyl-CoA dehydrogenase NAD-binding domain-containing protein [unclassified Nocardioides]|uniref:3-hydroxyacyl-CoA dehydrogenase NAD-binding domain-containing protein n=1 Tax=unclassified Nocardioides TaxID=2615069 RepID=UPI0006FF2137|nr:MULTISPECIES: 3-hydroxyacyl-CoA dehydrogenase NAD-binding domain-containing protein [unclassified Nocardioides]KRA37486.1 3-hydroxyacyl-CoA dehydrogenase [Nocardioides sp. Root614]KRA91447.1 3-hydroxyacyl-CoA dehydrogenase [Nocardioides sp. Root682]
MTSSEQIFNTLVLPYLNHAVRTYESGYASVTDIDAAMRFGCGYPKGPLTVVDEIGAAQVRDLLAARFAETGDHLHQPADLLEKLAADGRTFAEEAAAAGESATPTFKHDINRVGVVGTGTMASGIVQVFAQAGYDVVYVGRSQDKLDGVIGYITKNLDRAIAKGKGTEDDKADLLGRLTGSTEREALGDVDIVVEAIAEDLEIKLELFRDLDKITKPGAILATTTSSLPITQLGEATSRPEDVIGMHFFNPAPVMKLVEIITTSATSADVDETVRALTANVGKVGVSAGDRAGFIVNLLLFPYLNDAVTLSESGVELTTIDAAIKETAGLPMGPFELLDVVGNDVSLAIQKELFTEFAEPGFAPAKTLVAKVDAGELGRKTGAGFHNYAK